MKVSLVTGASGWIGLELTKSLLEDGHIVKALDRSLSKNLLNLKEIYKDKLLIIQGNMTDIDKWKHELDGIDYLYHLAAKVHSKPTNKEEEEEFYLINRDCTKELFNHSLKYNVGKVVFISTVAVYGEYENKVININTERKPKTPYAISKNDAEMYGLKLYIEKSFPITIIQPVTVYGGKDVGNFKKLYNLAQKGIIVKFGTGENKKTIIHYKDLVHQVVNISKSEYTNGKTFICGVESISYNVIFNKIKKSTNAKIIFNIPTTISHLLIKMLNNFNIARLSNLASNIETLMKDNIYNCEESLKYINKDEHISFEKWDCNKEYSM